MSNYGEKRNESVPLLSSNTYKYKNRSKNSNKQFDSSKRVSSFNIGGNNNNTDLLASDFDHVDSWGMLHESDTDFGYNYDLERGDRLMDSSLLNDAQIQRDTDQHNAFIDHTHTLSKDESSQIPNHLVSYKYNSHGKSSKKNKNNRGKNKKKNIHGTNNPKKLEGDVVIDVDALLQHVQQNTITANSNSNNNISLTAEDDEYDSTSSFSSYTSSEEDEYNSRPSSRGSSSSHSSLDDVCLVLEDETTNDNQKIWPDVSVLEEFSKEETERLRRQALEDAERFHLHYDETEEETDDNDIINRNKSGNITSINKQSKKSGIFFSHPIVTNIDVPELENKKVNEAEHLSKNGRLRPKKVAPWHLMQRPSNIKTTLLNGELPHSPVRNTNMSGTPLNLSKLKNSNIDSTMRDNFLVGRNIQYPHHIISNNPEHFRFAYFRMDLDATVHSPTISGLLQPGQKFEDLFVSSIYMNPDNLNQDTISTKVTSPSSPQNNNPTLNSHNSSNANMVNTTLNSTLLSQPQPQPQSQPVHSVLNKITTNISSNHSGTNLTTYNSGTGSGIKGKTPSIALEDIHPFWLDVINPTEEEMKVLSKAFGIHPLTTEDIFLGEIREKVELFKDYYLICFRSFDIVAEKHTRRKKFKSETFDSSDDSSDKSLHTGNKRNNNNVSWFHSLFRRNRRRSSIYSSKSDYGSVNHTSVTRRRRQSILKKREEREKFKRKSGDRHKPRAGELEPLNVYIIVFRTGVLTFHFAPTPHPINVRRRARLLKDYLNVTSDWIAYALIDDITDAFGPMIELIEDEVYDIEDAIIKMNQIDDTSSSSDSSDSSDSDDNIIYLDNENDDNSDTSQHLFSRRSPPRRRKSIFSRHTTGTLSSGTSRSSKSSNFRSISTRSTRSTRSSSSISTFNANIIGWKKKGDMLRRIGDCRKRVMSILRLLGAKADVIKGFAKRYNGQWDPVPQTEIGMYLDDIQDHIITMVSSLNHYEKLLSRSHSNYLAQINIDMTKVNNDMNDVLGKITILGTIVLPMNVITGLWGMNVIVPGQFNESLTCLCI
ncbi:hypothetical protein RI543_004871 [Arxiozyma heterogenica]|uniref:Uncharacterized protein n=1 Tax=Arxiozyma heterogenica TaxID=278026 RepID=A0AAN7WJ25_9SACH|nr:hypothetical protein RI543_004871 [Kazachstania heterogenica]